jgi:hypothetical protein
MGTRRPCLEVVDDVEPALAEVRLYFCSALSEVGP